MIFADSWGDLDGIRHGFATRRGGLSEGLYHSLNCGFGSSDLPERVAGNRARAVGALGLGAIPLVTVHQIHSPHAHIVDEPWSHDAAPQGDALVTRASGLALGVLAADCVPVLFVDPGSGVIGAAHAGWKGALGGVIEATIDAMITLGAKVTGLHAAIGPAIQQCSYEVGPEFRDRFAAEDPASVIHFVASGASGKFRFDLPCYVENRLRRHGVARIDRSTLDTVTAGELFFSYRRSVHRGESDFGRNLSLIALRP